MISSGKALESFRLCIKLQGGNERILEDTSLLPGAKSESVVASSKTGYITATHCRDFGVALALLEGGRGKKEDRIDHGVGLEFHKRIGDKVEAGERLVTIQYNSGAKLAEARELIAGAFEIGNGKVAAPKLVSHIVGG
jgi:pyrimidine-nucleoside phosphorylase